MENLPANEILTVSQATGYIKSLMDGDPLLTHLLVRGEISNYRRYPSGHHYFTLKDAGSVLKCVMFKGDAARLRWKPEDQMTAIAGGRISVFPRDGQYQLYCSRLTPDGIGELAVAFEQRKRMMEQEGLFDARHKKPLPTFPSRVALVTSPAGAAVRDMIRILGVRWPLCEVLVVPVRVQGAEAAGEIAEAIDRVNRDGLADVIITGRGGGSLEDLWAFNEEIVARAIFQSHIPVVSAVGHEPDVTIADFVADVRAATPSNAAELTVPDALEWSGRLPIWESRMSHAVHVMLKRHRQRWEQLAGRRVLLSPLNMLQDRRLTLDFLRERLGGLLNTALSGKRAAYASTAGKLDALSPLKVLSRGYGMATLPDGTVVRRAKEVRVLERLHLRFSDGTVQCLVEDIDEKTGI